VNMTLVWLLVCSIVRRLPLQAGASESHWEVVMSRSVTTTLALFGLIGIATMLTSDVSEARRGGPGVRSRAAARSPGRVAARAAVESRAAVHSRTVVRRGTVYRGPKGTVYRGTTVRTGATGWRRWHYRGRYWTYAGYLSLSAGACTGYTSNGCYRRWVLTDV